MDAVGSAEAHRQTGQDLHVANDEYDVSDDEDESDDDEDDDDGDDFGYEPDEEDAMDDASGLGPDPEARSRGRRDVNRKAATASSSSRSVRSCWPPSPAQQSWTSAPIWAPLFRVTAVHHPVPQPPPPPAQLPPPSTGPPPPPRPQQPAQPPPPPRPQQPAQPPPPPRPQQPAQPSPPPRPQQPAQPPPPAQPRHASRPTRRPPAQVPRPVPVVRPPTAEGNPVYGNRMKLFCRTGYHLTIGPRGRVTGTSNTGDKYAVLEFSSVANGEVRIRGVEANLFLAMNREGKLYGQANVRQEGTVFVEMLLGQYNTYLSRKFAHAGWYVGIKKNGKQKPGHKTAWGQKAIQFLPMRVV